MKTTKTLLFSFLMLFILQSINAYEGLRIIDPQNTWRKVQGTIDEATISVQPKGVYTEIGLYLTISAPTWRFQSDDLLEIILNFDLPNNAVVHDSWLWVEGDIIRAKILDKWTASEIYEDIVNRRRDPSILYKTSKNSYELRVYPMKASESRKLKITYLIPSEWNQNFTSSILPMNILKTSLRPISNINVITKPNAEWKNPQILEFPSIQFNHKTDTVFGDFMQALLPSTVVHNNSINISYDSPMKDGLYVNKFHNGDEGLYQMAFIPSKVFDISSPTKQAFIVDHDLANSDKSSEQIFSSIKSSIYASLNSTDSFNLILSNFSVHRVSNTWLSADSATIEHVFSQLKPSDLSSYSNLPAVLANGIEFIISNGFKGSIVLISSSSQYGSYQTANRLLDDIIALSESDIPIHVVDFQEKNKRSYYIGGKRYTGNGYFYSNLARLTSGNHYTVPIGGAISNALNSALNATEGFLGSFDLHTSLENGYCYSRFNIGANSNTTYLDQPILQVGKYYGSLPFLIEVSGVFENTIFSEKISLATSEIYQADSLSEEAWTGNYLQYLEAQHQSNDVINEIIDYSIDERVLSIYTAFLCLEPAQGGEVCFDCFDETEVTATDDPEDTQQDSVVNAYPNPFRDQITFDVSLPEKIDVADVSFTIYNMMGKAIYSFETPASTINNKYKLKWDFYTSAQNRIFNGQYIFMVNTPEKNYMHKIMHIE